MKELTLNEVKEVSGGWNYGANSLIGAAAGGTFGAYLAAPLYPPVGSYVGGYIGTVVGGFTGSIFDNGRTVIELLNAYGAYHTNLILSQYNMGFEIID
ncbi:MAG: Blp family class II bacteriocin [Cardiobacteriaceae bacterium]|nr:Blp family class II bacteriocin [Cardiobacteriaceae bacterium]